MYVCIYIDRARARKEQRLVPNGSRNGMRRRFS
jgi:hypothetical protein